MSHFTRPSGGPQDPTAIRRHLTGSSLKAAELLSSLGQDDLVRPELRNDVLITGERPQHDHPGRTTTGQQRRLERGL